METARPRLARLVLLPQVPPSGGSLEIGNVRSAKGHGISVPFVPPSGGSLELGNVTKYRYENERDSRLRVPPSGGSLEIGN